jgi:hypothetical protein
MANIQVVEWTCICVCPRWKRIDGAAGEITLAKPSKASRLVDWGRKQATESLARGVSWSSGANMVTWSLNSGSRVSHHAHAHGEWYRGQAQSCGEPTRVSCRVSEQTGWRRANSCLPIRVWFGNFAISCSTPVSILYSRINKCTPKDSKAQTEQGILTNNRAAFT